MGFPGKNTGVGCHFPLQGIISTQGSNPCLLHWQTDSLSLSHLRSPHLPICASVWIPEILSDVKKKQEKGRQVYRVATICCLV